MKQGEKSHKILKLYYVWLQNTLQMKHHYFRLNEENESKSKAWIFLMLFKFIQVNAINGTRNGVIRKGSMFYNKQILVVLCF